MDDKTNSQRRSGQGGFKSTMIARFLTPIAAAGASAAAGYAAKKAPDFFEKTVLPRLKTMAGDAGGVGGVARELPSKAASVASSAGDVAQDLTEKAKSLVASAVPSGNGNGTNGSGGRSREGLTLEQLEQRRDERARARAARRKSGGH
jgi:hypothetical protein